MMRVLRLHFCHAIPSEQDKTKGIYKLKWILFGVKVHFLKHPCRLDFVPRQIVVKFCEK
jgi:hypothetical protein